MKREKVRALKELAYYSSLGFQVVLSIFIGLTCGVLSRSKIRYDPVADVDFSGSWNCSGI